MLYESFDVVVVGGGPAGIAAALALAERGLSSLVIERSNYQQPRIGETFPPEILRPLVQLGLWEDFKRAGYVPSAGIRSFWGSAVAYEQSFIFNPYGTGWHVDRSRFDSSIAQAARTRGVRLALESRLLTCEPEAREGWRLRYESRDGRFQAEARYLLDATGRASTQARRLGAKRIVYDKLVGIYGFFRRENDDTAPEQFTLIEAAESGWWYSAPLPCDGLVVVHMTDSDLYPKAFARDPLPRWKEQLQYAPNTLERMARFRLDGNLRVAQASSSRLVPLFGKGWVAAGDAATAQDPLSGDGVCRALLSGIQAAAAISADLSGDASALPLYGETLEKQIEDYLKTRELYYSREGRWPDSPFWKRRIKAGDK